MKRLANGEPKLPPLVEEALVFGRDVTKAAQQLASWEMSEEDREERGPLIDQICRAALGVPKAMAEGYGKATDRQYLMGLRQARGSLFEVRVFSYVLGLDFDATLLGKLTREIETLSQKILEDERHDRTKSGITKKHAITDIMQTLETPLPPIYYTALEFAKNGLDTRVSPSMASHIAEGWGLAGLRMRQKFLRLAHGSAMGCDVMNRMRPVSEQDERVDVLLEGVRQLLKDTDEEIADSIYISS